MLFFLKSNLWRKLFFSKKVFGSKFFFIKKIFVTLWKINIIWRDYLKYQSA